MIRDLEPYRQAGRVKLFAQQSGFGYRKRIMAQDPADKEMSFLIRPIASDDTKAVLESYRSAVAEVKHADYGPEIITEWASRTHEEFECLSKTRQRFVAEDNGTIIGYTGLDINRSVLTECYVSPLYSGKGVGTALVQKVVLEAGKAGLTSLNVLASLNAVDFYKRNGFLEKNLDYLCMADGQKMRCMVLQRDLI